MANPYILTINYYNSMQMVWPNLKDINGNVYMHLFNFFPTILDNFPRLIQNYLSIFYFSEQTFLVFYTDGDKIISYLRIIAIG